MQLLLDLFEMQETVKKIQSQQGDGSSVSWSQTPGVLAKRQGWMLSRELTSGGGSGEDGAA